MLAPGGQLLLDFRRGMPLMRLLRHWPGLRGAVAERAGCLRSDLRWDAHHQAIRETFRLQQSGTTPAVYHDYFAFPSTAELWDLLAAHGLRVERVCGSFTGEPLRPWSRRLVVCARRCHD